MKKSALLAIIPALLAACSGKDNPEPEPIVSNVVTYEGTTAENISTFTFQTVDDSPVITLTAAWAPEAGVDLRKGERLLAYYVTATPGQSGTVEKFSCGRIPGGEPLDSIGVSAASGEPLGVLSIYRSGLYVNLFADVYFAGQARQIALCVDPDKLGQPQIDAYIIVETPPTSRPETSAPRRLVASWDIAELWQRSSLTSLRIHYLDRAGRPQSVLLAK